MKLVIQIPCYNEAEFLAKTIDDIPAQVPGFTETEILVVDDGSGDRTAEIAAEHPRVKKVVKLPHHQGLAAAFRAGVDAALKMSADVIVNTDADNQYPGREIPALVKPITDGRAEFVIGCRDMDSIAHFSPSKKLAQKAGSLVVSAICGQSIPDVTSGFRAFDKHSALWLDVIVSNYTYTLETLVRLASQKIRITHIPITVNPPIRTSRLMKSTGEYIARSAVDILSLAYIYFPLRLFVLLAALLGLPGLFLIARFIYYYVTISMRYGVSTGYTQSLTIGVGLVTMGFLMLLMGIISSLIHANRRILERLLFLHHKDRV